ncbi:hypothetical protein RIF29_28965 [Crotalaria pallida]|uniref:Uncharacterized protein n=1 Tax=Crotalaria pallida TaxID=3830 RepID=A0AAN9EDR1_CROPI
MLPKLFISTLAPCTVHCNDILCVLLACALWLTFDVYSTTLLSPSYFLLGAPLVDCFLHLSLTPLVARKVATVDARSTRPCDDGCCLRMMISKIHTFPIKMVRNSYVTCPKRKRVHALSNKRIELLDKSLSCTTNVEVSGS